MNHADVITINPGIKTLGALHHPGVKVTEATVETVAAGSHAMDSVEPRTTPYPHRYPGIVGCILRLTVCILAFLMIQTLTPTLPVFVLAAAIILIAPGIATRIGTLTVFVDAALSLTTFTTSPNPALALTVALAAVVFSGLLMAHGPGRASVDARIFRKH